MSDETPRVERPERRQLPTELVDLERLVPEEHPVRSIRASVERLDLREHHDAIVARGSEPGRPAKDPKLLPAPWLEATAEAVGSARLLSRLSERDAPYRRPCGGVQVCHHAPSDFGVGHGKKLDELLTQDLAALMRQGRVSLRMASQGWLT